MEVTGVSSINILWLRGRHSRQLHVFHQAVHSVDTDVNAIITLQYVSNLIGAKSFVVVSVNVQYIGPDFPYYEGQGWKRSAYSRYFCLPVGRDTRS